jgi:hypothetical protein
VAEVLEALVNFGDVMAELWPLDDSPRILLRVLIHHKFGALLRDNESERCKIIAEFCDGVMRENASRAVGKEPPLSFRQAKERWSDVAERFGPQSSRPARQDGRGQQNSGGGGNGGGQGKGGVTVKSRGARYNWAGKQYSVCFDFKRGSCNRKASGCVCEDSRGTVFAHVCNYHFNNSGKHCLAQHPRVGNH